MDKLLLWLLFGCVGYMVALAVQLEKLIARVHKLEGGEKMRWHSRADYARGLACILLGPLVILLVAYLEGL